MTKSMPNKDIADKLTAYFETQDPKVVARALAGAQIDYHRMSILEDLPVKERNRFWKRVRINAKSLEEFLRNGGSEDLIVKHLPPKEKA